MEDKLKFMDIINSFIKKNGKYLYIYYGDMLKIFAENGYFSIKIYSQWIIDGLLMIGDDIIVLSKNFTKDGEDLFYNPNY